MPRFENRGKVSYSYIAEAVTPVRVKTGSDKEPGLTV